MRVTKELLGSDYRYDRGKVPGALSPAQKAAREEFLEEVDLKGLYVHLEKCPYCGNDACTQISETDAKGLPCDIAVCDNCGGCFKLKVFTPAAAALHYGRISYRLRGKDPSDGAIERLFWDRVRMFAYPRYRFIRHFVKLEPGRDLIAEFGCGDGANLFPWKENGFDVLGIEYDPAVCRFGRQNGMELVAGDLMTHEFGGKKPKLIILSHFLEHVPDVTSVLRRVRSVIAPDGKVFIEVPGARVHGIRKPLSAFDVEHSYYFDLGSLSGAARRNGFRMDYGDEFIRTICSPVPGEFQDHLAGPVRGKLGDIMRQAEKGSLGIKMLDKFNNIYYRLRYAVLSAGAPR
ncbi:MAG: class I SAM-dependent methyltransferase [Candidatus Omnitrophota bacterium]